PDIRRTAVGSEGFVLELHQGRERRFRPEFPHEVAPVASLALLARRLTAGQVAGDPLPHPPVELDEDPRTLAVPVILHPAGQVTPQSCQAFLAMVAQSPGRADQLSDPLSEPLGGLPAGPTQYSARLTLLAPIADAPMVEAEEVEPFLILHHPRLLRVQRQPQVRQLLRGPLKRPLGVRFAA